MFPKLLVCTQPQTPQPVQKQESAKAISLI